MKHVLLACALALCACDAPHGLDSGAAQSPLAPANLPSFFDCLRENSVAVVAAHRGGPAPGYAENAIATFEHTLSQGPALIEVDVSRTRDGALVLMHDDTIERTTNGEGDLRDLTLAEVQALNLRDENGDVLDVHPPSLREALDWARGRTLLELDVKRSVSYEDVVREVREADAMGRVLFVTYSVDGASRMARVAPDAMIYTTIESAADLDTLSRRGVDLSRIVAWTGTDEPSAALNVALAQRGVEVSFGTLGGRDSWDARFQRDGHDQYAAFAETGLQVIATDEPAAALRALDASDGVDGFAALQCARAS
ncbi:MAG: glycerophosphodiester phosphodiesterase family protein [Hyphomonadaceae bacterium]